jgi:hypothetical protein
LAQQPVLHISLTLLLWQQEGVVLLPAQAVPVVQAVLYLQEPAMQVGKVALSSAPAPDTGAVAVALVDILVQGVMVQTLQVVAHRLSAVVALAAAVVAAVPPIPRLTLVVDMAEAAAVLVYLVKVQTVMPAQIVMLQMLIQAQADLAALPAVHRMAVRMVAVVADIPAVTQVLRVL